MLEGARWSKIAAMNDETTTGVGTFSRPSTVLQTYTVPLQQVRRELGKWKEPLTDEYLSLTSNTKALRPTTTEALKLHPNYAEMEVAPDGHPHGESSVWKTSGAHGHMWKQS